ncbi:LRR receptor-like serine/threonine-protein kinase IOS1 [Wolffia australiana]
MGLRVLLNLSCFLALLIASQAQPGFISVDCGLERVANYTDQTSGILYSPDEGIVDSGIPVEVPSRPAIQDLSRRYMTMRSFPNGTRNCYSLGPTIARGKYLVRAVFLYGNYDNKNQPPQFDIYLGVNLWQTVKTISDDTVFAEIIAVSPSEKLQVCLVNTGSGTPFISVLEVRPLLQTMYRQVNETWSFVLSGKRVNYGGTVIIRYPADKYDRLWFGTLNRTGWTSVAGQGNISRYENDIIEAPPAVLSTAVISDDLSFNASVNTGERVYVFMSFTELQRLGPKDIREFTVYYDGKFWFRNYRPEYMKAGYLYTSNAGTDTWFLFTLNATGNSTLPPMMNAREVYGLRQLTETPTDDEDVETISQIKGFYKVVRNWQGDPCFPQEFSWNGVVCKVDDTGNPRIQALNLSGSGLEGRINPLLANLVYLTSLDLSNNNLTGEIPAEIAKLRSLRVLDLRNNQLSGAIPQVLYQRSQSGTLLLSIDGNTNLCNQPGSCVPAATPKKKKYVVPVIAGVLSSSFVAAALVFLLCRMKRKEQKTERNPQGTPEIHLLGSGGNAVSLVKTKHQDLDSKRGSFSFQDIVKITRNFERMIGRGGFGIVYYGTFNDGTEVAVKMVLSSSQGAKEFEAEAKILTRVHHKSLVSLLGYCDDKNNLALVYEYMPKGSLADILSDEGTDGAGLNWEVRLKIASEVAQGLEYLHCFCKPSVVHRDVKSRNILLDEKLHAKLGDFGLSKAFTTDDATHMSTKVAGTPGYLDPEYYQSYRLTEKSDVYSFGIVLWEIISGLPPVSSDPQGGQVLPWLISRAERGDISSIADKRMKGMYDLNSIWKAVEIAMACVSPESTSRPRMNEVAMQLKECCEFATSREMPSLSSQMSNPNEVMPSDFGYEAIPSAR